MSAIRRLFARRIRDQERLGMFLLAVIVLIVTAVVLSTIGSAMPDPAPSGRTATTNRTLSPTLTATPELTPEPTATPEPPRALPVRQVQAAARKFLRGYLPYTYGRRGARRVRAATRDLRRVLAKNPPRVPATVRRRRPRVRHLQCEVDVEVACDALVSDGRRRYSVPLRLEHRDRWRVTAVR